MKSRNYHKTFISLFLYTMVTSLYGQSQKSDFVSKANIMVWVEQRANIYDALLYQTNPEKLSALKKALSPNAQKELDPIIELIKQNRQQLLLQRNYLDTKINNLRVISEVDAQKALFDLFFLAQLYGDHRRLIWDATHAKTTAVDQPTKKQYDAKIDALTNNQTLIVKLLKKYIFETIDTGKKIEKPTPAEQKKAELFDAAFPLFAQNKLLSHPKQGALTDAIQTITDQMDLIAIIDSTIKKLNTLETIYTDLEQSKPADSPASATIDTMMSESRIIANTLKRALTHQSRLFDSNSKTTFDLYLKNSHNVRHEEAHRLVNQPDPFLARFLEAIDQIERCHAAYETFQETATKTIKETNDTLTITIRDLRTAHEQLSTDTAQQAMKPFLTYTLDALNGYIQRNEGYIRELDTTRRTIKDVSKQIIERLKEQIK